MPGESPPPPPRACFGRDELIETVVDHVENLNPIALVGVGGIGKTSIALTVLHHDRIKKRFGDNRRFIRCDQFPPSRANFLRRLSKVIGAGVENPDDLTTLRQFLSSKEMFIILDNAESILDPQGAEGQEIYSVVKELSQFNNLCLAITSRITTIPPECKRLNVPTLSIDAARSTFYRIYDNSYPSKLVDKILEQLDFHPLSVTLLATVAHQNDWDDNRLTAEWEKGQTDVLHTRHNESLAATIELSLASPMFKNLGPDARDLLGVIAFFPQGIDENNLDWLFPTISNRTIIFDEFRILSLTYRSDGFITMLVPLRDYLCPRDPMSSPLLRATKESYFTWMAIEVDPQLPWFGETRWITSEDTNVEHLINVLTSLDNHSSDIWSACIAFFRHIYWHKPRNTVLGPKIEGLPDDHRSKPECLLELGRILGSAGNYLERKRLLVHALKLERERGSDQGVACVLKHLSTANRELGLCKEGICQVKEALEIYEQIGATDSQAECCLKLTQLLAKDNQLDAAEEAASRIIELLPEKGEEFRFCQAHYALGNVYSSKNKRGEAIYRYETALGIASRFNWNTQLSRIYRAMAKLFRSEGRFNDAHTHIEQAKSHLKNDPYQLGRAAIEQARIYYQQQRLENATSEVLYALEIFKRVSALHNVESCKDLLWEIEQETKSRATCGEPGFISEILYAIQFPAPIDSPSANDTPSIRNTHRDADRASGRASQP